ncbi:MAG: germination protein YpeB [Ruminococcus sp.]|nr:germination protein YpeB [Ruminococcus sp.]
MKRRTMIRVISFTAIAAAVLLVRNIKLMQENNRALRSVEAGYSRAIEELSLAADNISNTLRKELYAGTADMHAKLSQQLWRDSSTAKAALAQLPVGEMNLGNTYKFLSQVGNYALAMSEKVRQGETISDEEYKNLEALFSFSEKLKEDMWALEGALSSGEMPKLSSESAVPNVTEGFTDFEEGFDSYPTLVYDGPFSDHILEKTPIMTSGKERISREKALETAALALKVDPAVLTSSSKEEGKMPSFLFSDSEGSAACAVTEQGGYISYLLKSREVMTESLSDEEALRAGDAYLESLGIGNMRRTYYENINHVMTINYAYYLSDICCYTDLIKVSVAMDTGEIVGYDARGYLVNHQRRFFSDKRISVLDAQKKLSPKLKVLSRGLAVIPSDSQEELLCYEFKCETADGTHVLVYFNAYSGEEEQILILFESESGTLTM